MADSATPPFPDWGACFYDHFANHLGGDQTLHPDHHQPGLRYAGPDGRTVMQLLVYDGVFADCRTFCTLGLSRSAAVMGGVAEVMLPIDDGWEVVPDILVAVLAWMLAHQVEIGWGLPIAFGTQFPEVVATYGKSSIYFSTPIGFEDGFDQVACGDQVGTIYLACFLTAAEHAAIVAHGADSFETHLEAHAVNMFHLRRVCSLTDAG